MRRWSLVVAATALVVSCLPTVQVGAALVPAGKAKIARVSVAGDHVLRSELELSGDGRRATAVWVTQHYDAVIGDTLYSLWAATAAVTSGVAMWGAPEALVEDSGDDIADVDVALSTAGSNVVIVWARDADPGFDTAMVVEGRAATLGSAPVTQSWSATHRISSAAGADMGPRVSITSDGSRALVAWTHISDTGWGLQAATVASVGADPNWGVPVDALATPIADPSYDYISDLRIGLSSDGTRATVGWIRSVADSQARVQSTSGSVSQNSSQWGAVRTLATGSMFNGLDLAMSADGRSAIAVWGRADACGECVMSSTATIESSTATWGTAMQISAVEQHSLLPQVALSEDGSHAIAAWQRRDTGAFLTPDGNYLRPEVASATIGNSGARWGDSSLVTEDEVPTLYMSLSASSEADAGVISWMKYDPSPGYAILKPSITSFTVSGNVVSPVSQRALGKFPSTLSASSLHAVLSDDSRVAAATWVVDVDNSSGDPDIAQVGIQQYTLELDPQVDSLSPSRGPVTGGAEITIKGRNFTDVTDVDFGSSSADDFTVVSDTRIVAILPENDRLGRVDVTVTTASGEAVAKRAFEYVKGPAPRITRILPPAGGLIVEDEITITGAHFYGQEVLIGGREAETVEYVDSTEIVVRVPKATRLGYVDVTVQTLSGSVTKANGFEYVVVPAPPSGVDVEVIGSRIRIDWDRMREVTAVEVTCTNSKDDITLTASLGRRATSATLEADAEGNYSCVVQGVGVKGAMGRPSRSQRLTVR